MRLRRLHLTRYGGFSDAVLDLPRPDGPDVTIVLGPNEAGKSTAFSAWLDVLFGFGKGKISAAWRFPRSELEIGADLETLTGARHLRRRTGARDGLSDADGSPLPEGEVAALLHGLEREDYRTRFSLDRERLDAGGKDIAKGNGDLGNLLFAGMAGLPGIQAALAETRTAADAFHRLGGRRTKSTQLGAGLAELKEADAELRKRLTPEAQARHDTAVAQAEAHRDAAGRTVEAARRATACERDAVALRDIDATVAALDTQLAALPRCTWSPAEAEAARAALTEARRTETARQRAEDALRRAEADLKAQAAQPGEGVADAVLEALRAMQVDDAPVLDRLGPVNDGDLERITARRDATAPAIAEARARFGLDGPAAGLAERIEPVLRALGDAEAAAERAARARAEAGRTLQSLPAPADPGDTTALREALDTLRGLDLPALRRDRDAAAEALERLVLTGPIPDDLPDPARLQAQIARHRDAATTHATATRAEAEARAALRTRTHLAQAAEAAASGADAGAVEAARQARDAAWQVLRARLDAASADAFEAEMKAHDRLVAGLADAAARAETARATREARAQAEAEHDARQAETARAAAALARRDLASLATRLGLPPDTAPDALPPRLETLREARRATPKAARADAALAEAETTRTRTLARLRALLPDAPDPEDAARKRLRDAEGAAEAKGRSDAARTALERARTAETEAAAALAEARRQLEQERMAAGLGPLMLADLPALRALAAAEGKDAEDARRQSALLRARTAAAPELARLAALGDPGADPVAFARARATADREAVQRRAAATERRDTALAHLAEARDDATRAGAALDRALDGQGGAGPPDERVARLSEAARLRGSRDAALREAEGLSRRHDPDALEAARALPPDPARLATLQDDEAAAEARHQDAIAAAHDARRLRDDAQGGEDAALAVQARADVLADLGEGARRAAAALIGHLAGTAALSRLVQDNRGPMVATASAAFHRITAGEWEGLEVFGSDGMTLMAASGDRRAPVDSLSEGARAQLFLSLRVAGHAAFCARHGPLPFVTDDILEAFDDTRAEAALRMAGEMGDRGQVIFFTHHAHIAALAQAALPRVAIVEMPRQGA